MLVGAHRALSKSEIESWLQCQRKWGWERLNGIRSSNKYAEFGIDAGKKQELWIKDGIVPDQATPIGAVVLKAMPHWPAPKNIDGAEVHVETKTERSHYHGYLDVEYFNPSIGLWVVGDLKTVGSFKYSLTETTLLDDIQFNIYALGVMDKRSVERVAGKWVYVERNKPHGTRAVNVQTDRKRVLTVFQDKIDPVAEQIHSAYRQYKTATELEPNIHACSAYGGCPHIDRCNLSPLETMVSLMSKKQNLMDKFSGLGDDNVIPINGAAASVAVTPEAPAKEPTRTRVTMPSATKAKPSLSERLGAFDADAATDPAPVIETPVAKPRAETPIAKRLEQLEASEVPQAEQKESAAKTEAEAKTVSKATKTSGIFKLYVNCRPLRVATVNGNDVIDVRVKLDRSISIGEALAEALSVGEIKKNDHVVLNVGYETDDDELYAVFVRYAMDVVSGR